MNIEEADPVQAIRLARYYLGYFHIGESNRGYLGSGTIDFARIFDALVEIGYSKYTSIEAFGSSSLNDKLKAICAIWRTVWSDSDAFALHAKSFVEMHYAEGQRRAAVYNKY